ncbi:hypothetical protein THRCLA_07262 [Thraustotheca clavata]|uniref:PX domain-containing protein n=1 Tax=Thraustotheca clavata TaxID=74557 RepID=A0A1V9ZER4_9STRA|nr:hypothetical protein THRCLA_07262 [Thraustotheca clavata]
MYKQFTGHRSSSLPVWDAGKKETSVKEHYRDGRMKQDKKSIEKKRATTIDYEMTVGDEVALAYQEASTTMELPQPYVMQTNKNFIMVENCTQLTELLSTAPIRIQELGYYRTPDGFDMYVFECSLGAHLIEKRSWKIHRRYRNFDFFLSQLNALAPSMRFPSLSGSYLHMFRAKHCKDRLVELQAWLEKIVGILQSSQGLQSLPVIAKSNPNAKLFVLLCSFLFAGANTPYISPTVPTFALPAFAWSKQQVTVRLSQTPLYPSKVRSSVETDVGIGLRLAPFKKAKEEATVVFRGALVQAFLREQHECDLQHIRIGSQLIHINGVSVEEEEFQTILFHLRSMARPMQLTFSFDPRPYHLMDVPNRDRFSSLATSEHANSIYMDGGSIDVTEPLTPMHVFENVITETFGRKRSNLIKLSEDEVDENQEEEVESWDDIGGYVMDTISNGYFFSKVYAPKKATDTAFTMGIWTTSTGPMSIQFTGCKLRGKDAVYLSAAPMAFGAPLVHSKLKKPERQLERGMVLISINRESTFGRTFKEVMKMLEQASQPTTLSFRWFNEYSLFLGPNLDVVDQSSINRNIREDPTPTPTELNCLLEAQAKMFRSLQDALTENAGLRKDMQVVQESNRLLRENHDNSLAAYKQLSHANERLVERCQALQYALADVQLDVQQTEKERKAAESAAAAAIKSLEMYIEKAREDHKHFIKAHEARCIEECNKSIEVAKRAAAARTKKQVDDAVAALRNQKNAEIERLVEENAEEIEFLNQQLALWKHQVEVLTEADRRDHKKEAAKMREEAILRDMEQLETQDRRAGSRVRSASGADDGKARKASQPKPPSVWDRVLDSMIGD